MTERAPDLAGPILGWRVWRIAVDGELVSAYTPAGWPAGRRSWPAATSTRASTRRRRSTASAASTPATTRNAALFYAHRSGSAVVGRTKLWGRVVEHEAGWRAERAYPEAVYVPREQFDEAADDVAAHLAHRYGVPVYVVDELRSVLLDPDRRAGRAARHPDAARCRSGSPAACGRSRSRSSATARPPRAGRGRAARAAVRPGRAPAPAVRPAALTARSSGSGAGTGSSTGSTTITRCGSPISTRRCYHRAPAPSGALPTLLSRGRSTN